MKNKKNKHSGKTKRINIVEKPNNCQLMMKIVLILMIMIKKILKN